jgi:hypothetical protein
MSPLAARLVILLTVFSTQASAEVCLDSGPRCAFNAAFGQAFDNLDLETPKAPGWPELYRDGDRPVARYAYHLALDDRAHKALAQDRARFADLVAVFSSAASKRLCSDKNTAGFVTAGGIIEFWIGMHPKWDSGKTLSTWSEDKIVLRVDSCEAN